MEEETMLLGAHMSISGGIDKAVERGNSIKCTTIQIFTKSNTQWRTPLLKKTEVENFKRDVERTGYLRQAGVSVVNLKFLEALLRGNLLKICCSLCLIFCQNN